MFFKEWLLTEETYSFSCVLIPLEKIKNRVATWSKKHIKESKLYKPEGGRDKDTHVTALYGLHTKKVEDVRDILSSFKPFEIKLGEVSKFKADKYDVIKLEVSSPTLMKMNAALKKLPYTSKYPKYVPHCTLAYVTPGSCDALIGNKDFTGTTVRVKNVLFSTPSGTKTKIEI
jgi:2'-5' RNA ligase